MQQRFSTCSATMLRASCRKMLPVLPGLKVADISHYMRVGTLCKTLNGNTLGIHKVPTLI